MTFNVGRYKIIIHNMLSRLRAVLKNMTIIEDLLTYLKEVRLEVKKVNWPTRDQVLRYTLIVVAVSFAVAAFLGGLDFVFTTLLDRFIL